MTNVWSFLSKEKGEKKKGVLLLYNLRARILLSSLPSACLPALFCSARPVRAYKHSPHYMLATLQVYLGGRTLPAFAETLHTYTTGHAAAPPAAAAAERTLAQTSAALAALPRGGYCVLPYHCGPLVGGQQGVDGAD